MLSIALLAACGVGDASLEPGIDAATATASDAASEDAGDLRCDETGEGCTCPEPGASCTHSLGGVYGDRACSAGYQCCDGRFIEGLGACGPCACTEPSGEDGCREPPACFAAFEGRIAAIPPEVREQMIGSSWHAELDCPPLDSLRLLEVSHWRRDGTAARGELVVAASVAEDVVGVFRRLYDAGFPIERMERIDSYGGDDDASMAANNTSAFNCRTVTGGTRLSDHSFGTAIDINPVQNPYVAGDTVLPPAGAEYLERGAPRAGMIVRGGPVTAAFAAIGWGWGGDFSTIKDYQHFSASGN